jgi:aflatoxin B1 aldehyde reductase
MANSGARLIYGGAPFGYGGELSVQEKAEEVLNVLKQEGVKSIDTAQAYGTSEEMLGKIGAASRFVIDTKYPGGLITNDATTEIVIEGGKESLKKLKTDCVSSQPEQSFLRREDWQSTGRRLLHPHAGPQTPT